MVAQIQTTWMVYHWKVIDHWWIIYYWVWFSDVVGKTNICWLDVWSDCIVAQFWYLFKFTHCTIYIFLFYMSPSIIYTPCNDYQVNYHSWFTQHLWLNTFLVRSRVHRSKGQNYLRTFEHQKKKSKQKQKRKKKDIEFEIKTNNHL